MSDYYDSIAKGYNELHGKEQREKVWVLAKLIRPRPQHRLLDIGCGTGLSMEPYKCRKIGIDPSKGLLKQNPYPSKLASAESLPFKTNKFDYITCVTAIHNFKDIKKALDEIRRVAKPDAKMIITILKKSPKAKKIESLLKKRFKIIKKINQKVDHIFLLKTKTFKY